MSFALTRAQKGVYDFIVSYSAEHGYPPSFDEMKDAAGLRSKSGIHRIIIALEERGKISRLSNRSRSIVPIDDNLFLRLPIELTLRMVDVARDLGMSVVEVATRSIIHGLPFASVKLPPAVVERVS